MIYCTGFTDYYLLLLSTSFIGDSHYESMALSFGKQTAYTTVKAYGPSFPFAIRLPSRPSKVELDPRRWVLSEKTSYKAG
jgi:hypothetical protein